MKQSWKVTVAFVVVFILGGASGAVFALRYAGAESVRAPTPPEQFGPQLLRRWVFSKEMGLSPQQRQAIRPIVAETAEELWRLRREAWHNGQIIIERMQDAVAAVLTPEQRVKFEERIQAQRARVDIFMRRQQLKQAVPQGQPPQNPAPKTTPAAP